MLAPTPQAVILPPVTTAIVVGTTVVVTPVPVGVWVAPLVAGDIYLNLATAIGVDINVAAFAGAGNVTVTVDRKGADGVYYPVFTGPALTANGTQSMSAGLGLAGANSVFLGMYIRLRIIATGTAAANVTVSVQGA